MKFFIKEKGKKYVALLLVCVMITGLFPVGVFAESPVTIPGTGVTQTFNLSNSNVTINNPGTYVITQSGGATTNTVTINSNATLYLNGVNIMVPSPLDTNDYDRPNPININGKYTVNLYLVEGSSNSLNSQHTEIQPQPNQLFRGSGQAGIRVPSGATLDIYGNTGILNATGAWGFNHRDSQAHGGGGAGIGGNGGYPITGGDRNAEASGIVNIHGGVINATGGAAAGYWGNGGSGIGGGGAKYSSSDGFSGNVTIDDGTVTAIGGAGGTQASSGFAVGHDLTITWGDFIASSASEGKTIRPPLSKQPTLPDQYKWRADAANTYTLFPGTAYGYNSNQRYVEIIAEEPFSVSNIEAPASITTGSKLSITTPTVIGTPTSQGWEYSSNGSTNWTAFNPSVRPFTASENGYFIRYYATSEATSTHSNQVAITVNKYNPDLSISATPASATYPDNISLSATFLTGVDKLDGKVIKFYNGDKFLVEIETDTNGKATFLILKPTAETYQFRAVFDGDNYNTDASANLEFTVSKAIQETVSFENTSEILKTYGDPSFALPTVSGGSGEGDYSYRSSDEDVVTVSGDTITINGAGEATVFVKKLGDDNYNDSNEDAINVAISQKFVNITGMGANSKEYDGTDTATIIDDGAVIEDVINLDAVSIDDTNAVAKFSDKNAGNNKAVTYTGFALTGAKAANYTLVAQPASVTANIFPREITVSGITASDKIYDGNDSAILSYANTNFSGKLENDTLSVTATGTYTSKNVQDDGIEINISGLLLGGSSVDNYVLSEIGQQTSTSANITPSTITVTPHSGQSKFYGQDDPSISYSASGSVGSEEPAFSEALDRGTGEDIESNYAIYLGSLALENNGAFLSSNYKLALYEDQVFFEIKEYTTIAEATATPNGQNGWFNSDPITLVAPTGYQISTSNALDGNWINEITLNYEDGSDKSTTYYLRNTDTHAGAISTSKTFNYKVDQTAPSILIEDVSYAVINSGTLAQIGNFLTFGNFFKEGIKITIPATDSTSGLDRVYYTFKDADGLTLLPEANVSFNNGDANITINFDEVKENQNMNIEVYATDVAGNKSATETLEETNSSDKWTFDNTNPVIENFKVLGNDITDNQWFNNVSVTITSEITDDTGIYKVSYKIDNATDYTDLTTGLGEGEESATSYDFSKEVTGEGSHTVELLVTDNAMNTSTKSIDFQIDTTTPKISVVETNSEDWTNKDVSFTLDNEATQISDTTYQVKIGSDDYVDLTTLGNAWDSSSKTLTISTDTHATYQFKAISGAGLSNESTVYDVKVDKTIPVISTPTGMPENWVTEQETITFTVTENGSGIANLTVKNDDRKITPTECTTENGETTYTFVTIGNGKYTIDAVDNAANQAVRQTMSISKIDTDLPVITTNDILYDVINTGTLAKIGNFMTFGNFFKEGIKITIPATDATSGLDRVYYTYEDSDGSMLLGEEANVSFNNGDANIIINFDEVKDHKNMTIEVYATDVAGNKSATETLQGTNGSDKWTFNNTNPVIENFKVLGNDIIDNQGFSTSFVTVTSEITDDTGIYKVSYKIDNATNYTNITPGFDEDGVSATFYDFSKAVKGEGPHTVELLVTDNAMNTSTKSIVFQIDTTPPVIESVTGNVAEWQNTDVTLTVDASDHGSGLAENAYSFDGGANWQSDNTKVYSENQTIATNTIKVKDVAGNIQSYSSAIDISKIDKANPEDPSVKLNDSAPGPDWYNGYSTIHITPATHVEGTAPEATYYKLWNTSAETDNTEPASGTVLTAQPTIPDDGIWKLKTWTVDAAGNTSTPSTITIKVDATTPEILVETNSGDWTNKNVTFTLDNEATQLSETVYQVKIGSDDPVKRGSNGYVDITELGDAWDTTSNTLTISADTHATYQFKATSGAGLSDESIVYDVKVDKTIPVISTPTGMPEDWVTQQQTITFTTSENGSGIKSITVKNGDTEITSTEGDRGNDTTTYTFVTTGNGNYTIDAVDNASNQAVRQTMSISMIDTDLPVITTNDISYDVINTGTLAQIGNFLTFGNFFKEGIEITIPATDATSGLDELYYTIWESDVPVLEEANVSFDNGNAKVTINFDQVKDHKDMRIEVYATDIAGNRTETENLKGTNDSEKWTFENTNPVISNFKVSGNDITENQWFNNASVTVTSGITDDAGIYKGSYKIDGATNYTDITTGLGMAEVSATSYDFSKDVTGEGTHTVELLVTDNAMNTSTKSITFHIDAIAPDIASITGNATSWQNTDVTLTINASDNGSGLAENAYSFDGGANWQSDNTKVYSENQTIATNTIKVKDVAGNIQSYSSAINISKIDKANPEGPTVKLNDSIPGTDWYNGYPTIDITPATHVEGTAPEATYYKLWNTSAETDNTEPESGTLLTAQPTITNNGTFKLKTWTEDEVGNTSTPSIITIKVDTTTPNGDIKIGENSVKTLLNKVTFGLFFKQNIDVTVTGTDATSGIAKVEYYKSTAILDPQEVKDLTSWSEYKGVITETAVDSSRFIYYVKITDNADNVTYIASNGIRFDTTKPAITGITKGAVYFVDQIVTVTDTNLDTITLNGNPFESGNKLTGNLAVTYALAATDKAGNNTTLTVTMKQIASLSTSIDSLSVDNVKSSDEMAIDVVRSNVEAVLLTTDNGASQTQIEELNGILDKCNDLLVKIQDIKDKIADVNTKTNGITIDNVKSSDKTNLENALSTIKDLLATNNLTDSEKSALQQKKADTENALERILEVQNAVLNAYDPVKNITTDNVTKTDRIALEQAVDDLQNLLDNDANNLTASEIQEIVDKIDSIKVIINLLDKVAELENLIVALPNSAKVTKADTDAIAKAKDTYERLTDKQKEIVDSALKTKLEEAIDALKKELLFDAPTGTRLEGMDGTVFDLRTEFVVTPVMNMLDTTTMQKFALGVSSVAQGQQIAQLYDIELLLEGQAIQPKGMVRITLTLTDEQANYTNLQVVFIADDGTATIIPSTIKGKEISFITDHLSYYGIIGTPIKNTNQLPNTGGNRPFFSLIGLAFLSAAILLIVKKKRKFGADKQ